MKKINKIEISAKKIKDEVIFYKNSYLRALADYQNFEKRVEEKNEEIVKNASKRVILKLLPFLDNLDNAEIFIKDPGLNIIRENLLKTLETEGLEEIKLDGQKFNPEVAEAVDTVEGQDDGKISEIVKKGYKLNGKIIRPAQVKVIKKVALKENTS
jgi:molecular chaperone GrpE